jgi:arsenite/tail-anchored protein-transporting ATPase
VRVLLFTGKGGVGKTTLAAATAARLAAAGRKTLVVSTDPAHSLGDALGVSGVTEPVEVVEGLYAGQIDARRLVEDNWLALRTHLRTLLAGAGVAEVDAEELTVLPGVEELLALAEVYQLATAGPWEVVVVDCGPTAETLRLLALPEALAGYLERLFPTHRRVVRGLLAGLAGAGKVERWDAAADALSRLAEKLDWLRRMLTDPKRTTVRLVCTPERVVVAETRRTLTSLALQGIRVDGVVANRLVPDFAGAGRTPDGLPDPLVGGGTDAAAQWLATRRAEQQAVLAEFCPEVELRTVGQLASEPVGAPALLDLAAELYADGDPLVDSAAANTPLFSVNVSGTGLSARYELRVSVPLPADAELDLARVADELAITVHGRRTLIALPPVLRRCAVTDAEVDESGLLVGFRPDPALWPR